MAKKLDPLEKIFDDIIKEDEEKLTSDDWVSIFKGIGYSQMFPLRKKQLMDKLLKLSAKDQELHLAIQRMLFGVA
jgi:hypothetical protein